MVLEWRDQGVKMPALHASTQTDNRDADKVRQLADMGFSRVVLARELSLDEIRDIRQQVPQVELEAFVHGALCVCYSGACYASEYCFQRSANRGDCAQFCRLKFNLQDADGHSLGERYWLSLKDMCRIDDLEALLDAGVMSLKIEGRLKDADYVKNVVAAYNIRLNEIINRRKGEFLRSSLGRVKYAFTPDLRKTFNRGYTDYFLHGRTPDIASPDTPKAIGEYVGKVKEIRGQSFNVAGTAQFANGDGLCFFDDQRQLTGFRINRVENNRLFPYKMPKELKPDTALYRNADQAFTSLLAHETAVRTIPVMMFFSAIDQGFALDIKVIGTDCAAREEIAFAHQPAQKPQHDNIVRQLTKLGGTVFECVDMAVSDDASGCFIPSSLLADLRRQTVEKLSVLVSSETREKSQEIGVDRQHTLSADTLSSSEKEVEKPLMQCRHCLRFVMGYCVRRGGKRPSWHEPLTLIMGDGRRFTLQFDCQHCQMNLYAQV